MLGNFWKENGFIVTGKIHNRNGTERIVKLFIDSGATVSLIRKGIIDTGGQSVRPYPQVLYAATGDELSSMGETDVALNLGSDVYYFPFVIVHDNMLGDVDGVVGKDFIFEYKFDLYTSEQCMSDGKNKIPMEIKSQPNKGMKLNSVELKKYSQGSPMVNLINRHRKRQSRRTTSIAPSIIVHTQSESKPLQALKNKPHKKKRDRKTSQPIVIEHESDQKQANEKSANEKLEKNTPRTISTVRIRERTTIPARSEMLCEGKQQKFKQLNTADGNMATLLFEPTELRIKGILCARAIVVERSDLKIQLQIMNVTHSDIEIPKHTLMGNVERITGEYDTSPLNKETITSVTNQVKNKPTTEEIKNMWNLDHLADPIKNKMQTFLTEYYDLFSQDQKTFGCTSKIQHKIELIEGTKPIRRPPYRIPHSRRAILDECIQEMKEQGILEPTESEWSFPVLVVPKPSKLLPDGTPGPDSYRVVADMRGLNNVTKTQIWTLPNINETLDALGGAKYFTTLDMMAGYHQVLIRPEDREKCAIVTGREHLQYTRMVMGMKNSASIFQKLMDSVLSGIIGIRCMCYLDDIIVFSRTIEEHIERLCEVFDRLRDANLKLQPSKCHFLRTEIDYLGFVVSENGVKPNPLKVKGIMEYPRPTNVTELKGFLGVTGYYRRHINSYATRAKPLTELTKKEIKFEWEEAQEQAFIDLKNALCSEPVLAFPCFDKEFILSTDASNVALGAVLSQVVEGVEKPIGYGSRVMQTRERNYSVTERELLGLVFGIKYFNCYLYGNHFTVYCDHRPLVWLESLQDPTSRLARWSIMLSNYNFTVKYREGKLNTNADSLSRVCISAVSPEFEPIYDRQRIRDEQRKDPALKELIAQLTKDNRSNETYALDEDGLLYKVRTANQREDQLVVPKSMVLKIMSTFHDTPMAGHNGVTRCTELIKTRFFWVGMHAQIRQYCQQCISCNKRKTSPHLRKAPLQRFPEVTAPMQVCSMDIVGPLPVTSQNNKYILTFVDHFSKYPESIALPNQTAKTIATAFVTQIIARHGVPAKLITDCGANFIGQVMKEVCLLLRIKKLQTTSYHSEGNSTCERQHRTYEEFLSHYVNKDQSDWDQWLPYCMLAYRASPHCSTNESPFFLMHGRDIELPFDSITKPTRTRYDTDTNYSSEVIKRLEDAFREVRERARKSTERQHEFFNRSTKPVNFKLGDKVLLYTPRLKPGLTKKLSQLWSGPYRIIQCRSPVIFRIKDIYGKAGTQLIHANRLKLCNFAEEVEAMEHPEEVESEGEEDLGFVNEDSKKATKLIEIEDEEEIVDNARTVQAQGREHPAHRYPLRSLGPIDENVEEEE